ncbi:MAG TPA: O-antigen ligase family protein, partial [Candidatus Baltobacteraceae bacterium]|nr:O-antigen ligase family protein [Candidatus Baltobacteraceae bacterium]
MVKPKAHAGENYREQWLVLAMLSLTLLNAIQGKNGFDHSSSFLNEIAWSIAYSVAATRLLSMKRELPALLAGSAPLLVYLVLCFVSTLWSVEPGITLKNSIELIGSTVVALYIVASLKLADFLSVLVVFFSASAILSLLLIVASPGRGRMFWGGGAWDGIYEEKNALGAAMALAIIVILSYLLRRRAKFKLAAAGALALCVGLLAGSNSVTAILDCGAVLCIGALAIACVSPNYGGVARALAGIGATLAVAFAAAIGFNSDALYALIGRSQALSGRTDFWPYLYEAVKARPIFGYGYGAFFRSPASRDYLSYYVIEAGGWSPYHAHNSFLQACLDTGYVGLASVVFLIIAGIVRAIRFFMRER